MWRTGRCAVSSQHVLEEEKPHWLWWLQELPRLPGEQFFLNPVSVAVEECSLKGCLALSLLELLGFNLTFVFLGSLLVLIEVRWCGCCLLAYKVWDPACFLLNSVSGMSEN